MKLFIKLTAQVSKPSTQYHNKQMGVNIHACGSCCEDGGCKAATKRQSDRLMRQQLKDELKNLCKASVANEVLLHVKPAWLMRKVCMQSQSAQVWLMSAYIRCNHSQHGWWGVATHYTGASHKDCIFFSPTVGLASWDGIGYHIFMCCLYHHPCYSSSTVFGLHHLVAFEQSSQLWVFLAMPASGWLVHLTHVSKGEPTKSIKSAKQVKIEQPMSAMQVAGQRHLLPHRNKRTKNI